MPGHEYSWTNDWRRADIGAANGHGNARSVAILQSAVAVGGRIGLVEFQTAVEEILDVQVLPDLRFPEIFGFQNESICHTFVVPATVVSGNARP